MGITIEQIRNQILNADDLPRKKLSFRPWDMDLYIKRLSAKERDSWEGICLEIGECLKKNEYSKWGELSVKATLVCFSLCDESGQKIFPDVEDIPKINEKSGSILDKIAEEAQAYNEITEKDLDEMEKNLESAQENCSK